MRRQGLDVPWSAVLFVAVAAASAGAEPVKAPAIDKPLVAHWRFDEDAGLDCLDAAGRWNASAAPGRGAGLSRADGVHGGAIRFAGGHLLRVPGGPKLAGLPAISLSAWARCAAFQRYNEIFRKEDGNHRVLFSFQERGTILSLGLNVGGYVECDARIDPKVLLDGQWHHCAGTFDGQAMRVYLDGRLIGSLERRGTIAAGGTAPGCIASMNGGECFQGALDDLRIYRAALTAEEVSRLYRSGLTSLAGRAREVAGTLNFSSEYYFSRFFKKHSGQPPSAFQRGSGMYVRGL